MKGFEKNSIQVILENQAKSGAYIASPNFRNYHYCWFRDGAFIAYSMDIYGQNESAHSFYSWVADVIMERKEVIRTAIEKVKNCEPLQESDILHTRYTLTGEDGDDVWPNFQLDGLGAWLWGVMQHKKIINCQLSDRILESIDLTAQYLSHLWQMPCYDCWEEFPDRVHTYTLAALCGGLKSISDITHDRYAETVRVIRSFINKNSISDDHYVKYIGSQDIDAGLLGLIVPYGVFSPEDITVKNTIWKIEMDLVHGGGGHRYVDDTYYGGGEWILLTGWLGWYYAKTGERKKALQCLHWIERQFDKSGNLPEQVPESLNKPEMYSYWIKRWGNIAAPLLWSHAMYLILQKELR